MALRKSLRGKREGSPSWLESNLISAAAAVKPRQARAASPSSLKLRIQTAPHGNFPAIQINLLHAYWREAFVLASHDVPSVWMKEETESFKKKKRSNIGWKQQRHSEWSEIQELLSNGQLITALANRNIVLRVETKSQ